MSASDHPLARSRPGDIRMSMELFGGTERRGPYGGTLSKADYTKEYSKGWKHSETASSPSLERNPHDRGDNHKYRAWEDGYMDSAAGREKFALRGHRDGTGPKIEGY